VTATPFPSPRSPSSRADGRARVSGGTMSVGEIFSDTWELYLRHFRRLAATAAAAFVLVDLLFGIAADARGRSFALGFGWGVASLLAMFVGSAWTQGAVTSAVEEARLGHLESGVAELYRRTSRYLLPLLAWGLLQGLLAAVAG